MSSNRAAVSACMRRLTGVAPWGARSLVGAVVGGGVVIVVVLWRRRRRRRRWWTGWFLVVDVVENAYS